MCDTIVHSTACIALSAVKIVPSSVDTDVRTNVDTAEV